MPVLILLNEDLGLGDCPLQCPDLQLSHTMPWARANDILVNAMTHGRHGGPLCLTDIDSYVSAFTQLGNNRNRKIAGHHYLCPYGNRQPAQIIREPVLYTQLIDFFVRRNYYSMWVWLRICFSIYF